MHKATNGHADDGRGRRGLFFDRGRLINAAWAQGIATLEHNHRECRTVAPEVVDAEDAGGVALAQSLLDPHVDRFAVNLAGARQAGVAIVAIQLRRLLQAVEQILGHRRAVFLQRAARTGLRRADT